MILLLWVEVANNNNNIGKTTVLLVYPHNKKPNNTILLSVNHDKVGYRSYHCKHPYESTYL